MSNSLDVGRRGQRVRVYFNLHKQCLSVMDKATRRVIGHAKNVALDDVKFIVSQAGLERIRREKRKQVIAFVEGNLEEVNNVDHADDWQTAYFNPYKVDSFVVGEHRIDTARRARVIDRTVYVKD